MTAEKYKKQVSELKEKHQIELRKLAVAFANANNPYKKGDIIEDHYQKGKIIDIHLFNDPWGLPTCSYTCIEVKKDNTPKKGDKKITIYQTNIW